MNDFFSQYTSRNFTRDPTIGLTQEFDRLALANRWRRRTVSRKRCEFRTAMVEEFNLRYGIDDRSLASWQNLCRVFGIQVVPESISKCKQSIRSIHVNLVDMIELKNNGGPVRVFRHLNSLRQYTKETGKWFPKGEAKAGGILKHLLRTQMI
ncbi:hypothetical protein Q9L58_002701 [Maublancomyces gigas]|uniref:Uncharacterized protein n=1 Tax=Discina gigas TaxID=1032678 RepID=A0ABR3GR07_9PEZI